MRSDNGIKDLPQRYHRYSSSQESLGLVSIDINNYVLIYKALSFLALQVPQHGLRTSGSWLSPNRICRHSTVENAGTTAVPLPACKFGKKDILCKPSVQKPAWAGLLIDLSMSHGWVWRHQALHSRASSHPWNAGPRFTSLAFPKPWNTLKGLKITRVACSCLF